MRKGIHYTLCVIALLTPWHLCAKDSCSEECLPFQENLDWNLDDASLQSTMVSMLMWTITLTFTSVILALVIPNSVPEGGTPTPTPPPPSPAPPSNAFPPPGPPPGTST